MRVLYLFLDKICENFDILHTFLGLTVTKLSSLKTVRFFWPTLYITGKIWLRISDLYLGQQNHNLQQEQQDKNIVSNL